MKRARRQNIPICNIWKREKKIYEMNNKTKENIEMFKAVVYRAWKTKIPTIWRVKRTKKVQIRHRDTRECLLAKVNIMSHIMMASIGSKISSALKYLTLSINRRKIKKYTHKQPNICIMKPSFRILTKLM